MEFLTARPATRKLAAKALKKSMNRHKGKNGRPPTRAAREADKRRLKQIREGI